MARRERAVLITPMEGGLAVHSLLEERDLNRATDIFGQHAEETDPEMVALAKQLIKRQAGTYDPADVEDRYESRMRALIDAKLQGQGLTPEAAPAAKQSNVVDLMAALKKEPRPSHRNDRGQAAQAKTQTRRRRARNPGASKPQARLSRLVRLRQPPAEADITVLVDQANDTVQIVCRAQMPDLRIAHPAFRAEKHIHQLVRHVLFHRRGPLCPVLRR